MGSAVFSAPPAASEPPMNKADYSAWFIRTFGMETTTHRYANLPVITRLNVLNEATRLGIALKRAQHTGFKAAGRTSNVDEQQELNALGLASKQALDTMRDLIADAAADRLEDQTMQYFVDKYYPAYWTSAANKPRADAEFARLPASVQRDIDDLVDGERANFQRLMRR